MQKWEEKVGTRDTKKIRCGHHVFMQPKITWGRVVFCSICIHTDFIRSFLGTVPLVLFKDFPAKLGVVLNLQNSVP